MSGKKACRDHRDQCQQHQECTPDGEIVEVGHIRKTGKEAGQDKAMRDESQNGTRRHRDPDADVFSSDPEGRPRHNDDDRQW